MKSARAARNVVKETIIVLESTSFMLLFMTVTIGSFRYFLIFSLILSKTTTVSVREYPQRT